MKVLLFLSLLFLYVHTVSEHSRTFPGAVCACSTCQVYIEKGMDNLPEISDKEEDFIDRAINPRINSRLGCQCVINSDIEVTVPDQSTIIGH